ncbi:MAG: TonB-dependent receptor, partial [Candidatus Marinimicrobia bacterium]|nr:TonB-dependent receptor [Candidatus Neomarinimicrobiota bacterium]
MKLAQAHKRSSFFTIIILYLLITSSNIYAQTGSIRGRVVDKETNTEVIGANVIIKGTYKGAATDFDGNFYITGLTPGDYDIEVSTIGYKINLHTGVKVTINSVVTLDIELEPTVLAFGQEVVVIGKKPLFQPDLTSSLQRLNSDDIENKIAENIDDLLEQQAGIVKVDDEIHIRGGRADENLYIIDRVATKDPLTGRSYGVFLSVDAIDEIEIITGGFNAEYGQAMSGIIEVKTKEGGQEYHGSISIKSDHIGMEKMENFNKDAIEISLGGPAPFVSNILPAIGINIPGSLTFFTNGYMFLSDTYLPHASKLIPSLRQYDPFSQRQENNWSALYKLTWKYKNTKISGIYKRSLQINQGGFNYRYMNWLDHYNTITWEGIQTNLLLTHSFNTRTFIEADFGRVFINKHSAVQGKYFDEYEIANDINPIQYLADFPDGDITVWNRDGFYDTGDASNWHDHYSDTWTLKAELTSQISSNNRLKAGFTTEFTDMQVIDIDDPWLKGANNSFGGSWDIYRVKPRAGDFFIQDKIVYEGMIINVGLRYDYMILGSIATDIINDMNLSPHLSKKFREDFKDNTFKIFDRRGKAHLSPRLGISHPLTDNDVLFFSYGHFSQRPNYEHIYASLNKTKLGASPLLGNPDLNPTTTVAYEIGVKHKFSEDQVLNITAFYKDLFDYATSEQLTIKGEKSLKRPFMYFNMDYARSRGIEVYLQRRFSQLLSVRLNGTYSMVTGKSNSPNEALEQLAVNREKSLDESFMYWDVPFRLSTDFNFYIPRNENIRILNIPMPNGFGINIHWQISSGRRYTPMVDLELEKYDENAYSELAEPWQRWDLKITKGFTTKNINFNIFCQIENLFNAKISQIINPVTGRAWEPGDPIPMSWRDDLTDLPQDNP